MPTAVCWLSVGAALALGAACARCAELPDQLKTQFGPLGGEVARRPGAPLFGEAEDVWLRLPRGERERLLPYRGLGAQPLAPGAGAPGQLPPTAGLPQPYAAAVYGPAYAQYGLQPAYGWRTRARMYREKLEISGTASLSFRTSSVEGDRTLYDSQFIDTNKFDRTAAVYFTGRLTDGFYIDGQIRTSRYQPTHVDYSITYHRKRFDIIYGDLNVRLTNNPFATFTKSIRGVQVSGDLGRRGQYDLYVAEQRGRVRREVIPGEGHSGPYQLSFTPVREGSERVRVDGRLLSPSQYNLDPDSGFLYFENNMIIPPTSVIEVTYEEDRPGQAGRLIGFQATTSFGNIPFGITLVRQEGTERVGQQPQSVRHEERFFGNNSAGPFTLSFRPIDLSRPLTVLVDGVPKQPGVDYDFNPGGGTILFRQVVPATSTVVVIYYTIEQPDAQQATRTVLGIDTGFTFARGGVAINYGRSTGGFLPDGSPAPAGQAFSVRAQATLLGDKLAVNAGWVKEDPTFRRIQSATFQRDRSGTDAFLSFRPSEGVMIAYATSQDVSNEGLPLGAGAPFAFGGAPSTGFNFRTTQDSLSVDIQKASLPHINIGLDTSTTAQAGGAYSALRSRRVSVSDTFGNLALGLGYDRSDRRATAATEEGGLAVVADLSTEQYRADLGFHWGGGNSINLGYMRNRTIDPAGQGRDSSGEGLTAALSYSISEDIVLTAGRRFIRSRGAVFISGYTPPGGGPGYGGPGFRPPGYGGPISGRQAAAPPQFTQAATTDDSADAQISARLSDRLSITASYSDRLYDTEGDIGYLADNRTRTWGASIYYQPTDRITLGADANYSRTAYLDRRRAELTSEAYRLTCSYQATDKLSVGFGWSLINAVTPTFSGTGGGLTIISSTSYANCSFQANYSISAKQNLSLDIDYTQSRASFDDNDRWCANLLYDRQITSLLWLGLRLRYVNYDDHLAPPGAVGSRDYRALQFSAELNARF